MYIFIYMYIYIYVYIYMNIQLYIYSYPLEAKEEHFTMRFTCMGHGSRLQDLRFRFYG